MQNLGQVIRDPYIFSANATSLHLLPTSTWDNMKLNKFGQFNNYHVLWKDSYSFSSIKLDHLTENLECWLTCQIWQQEQFHHIVWCVVYFNLHIHSVMRLHSKQQKWNSSASAYRNLRWLQFFITNGDILMLLQKNHSYRPYNAHD